MGWHVLPPVGVSGHAVYGSSMHWYHGCNTEDRSVTVEHYSCYQTSCKLPSKREDILPNP